MSIKLGVTYSAQANETYKTPAQAASSAARVFTCGRGGGWWAWFLIISQEIKCLRERAEGAEAQVPAPVTHCRISVSWQSGGNYLVLLPCCSILTEGQAGKEETCVLTDPHNKEILTAERLIELRGNRSYCLELGSINLWPAGLCYCKMNAKQVSMLKNRKST